MPRDIGLNTGGTRPAITAGTHARMGRAWLYRRARSPESCAPQLKRPWVIDFDPQSPQAPELLMGWISVADPHRQLELRFPSREAALAYARRTGLDIEIVAEQPASLPRPPRTPAALADARNIPWQDLLAAEAAIGRAVEPDEAPAQDHGADARTDPWAIFWTPNLDPAAKRARLDELRLDALARLRADDDGMPTEPSVDLASVCAALRMLDGLQQSIVLVRTPAGRHAS